MSNFVHPAWHESFKHPPGTKFDHLGLLKKPFSTTKGGYVIIKRNGKVFENFGSKATAARFAHEDRVGHRSEHRKLEGLRIGLRPVSVQVRSREFTVTLGDRRAIAVPVESYRRLLVGSAEQRRNVELKPARLYWPDLDQEIGIIELLRA